MNHPKQTVYFSVSLLTHSPPLHLPSVYYFCVLGFACAYHQQVLALKKKKNKLLLLLCLYFYYGFFFREITLYTYINTRQASKQSTLTTTIHYAMIPSLIEGPQRNE